MAENKKFEHQGRTIRAEIRTTATLERAWEAWADPEKIAHWFVDRATGSREAGGTITWFFDKFNYALPYEILESVPGKRYTLRWSAPGRGPGILEITISREGGETKLVLVNSGFREGADWDFEYEGVVSGWLMSLAALKHYLENYFGQPRATFLAMRRAQFTFEQLRPYYFTADGLAKWLTTAGAIGEVGERCQLLLRDGGKLSGPVLAKTKTEIALGWSEQRGVCELKAFAMGPQMMLGVRGWSWGGTAARAKEMETRMEAALERLAAALGSAAAKA